MKKVLNWVVSVFGLLNILPLFLGLYRAFNGDAVADTANTMFEDYYATLLGKNLYEAPFFHTLVMILVFVSLACAVVYLVTFLLDTFGKGKGEKFAGVRKFVSIIALIAGILTIISGVVFLIANAGSTPVLGTKYGLKAEFGLIVAMIVPVICGILGLVANKRK